MFKKDFIFISDMTSFEMTEDLTLAHLPTPTIKQERIETDEETGHPDSRTSNSTDRPGNPTSSDSPTSSTQIGFSSNRISQLGGRPDSQNNSKMGEFFQTQYSQ